MRIQFLRRKKSNSFREIQISSRKKSNPLQRRNPFLTRMLLPHTVVLLMPLLASADLYSDSDYNYDIDRQGETEY